MSLTLTARRQTESPRLMKPTLNKIFLIFEADMELTLSYDLKGFSYKDFDSFVRQRFQVNIDSVLRYTQDFEEVVPSADVLSRGKLYITELNKTKEKAAGVSHTGTHTDHYYIYAAGIIAACAFALAPKSVTHSGGSKLFEFLDAVTIWLGLPSSGVSNTEWRTMYIEAFVAFMCRAITELVIRRGCNPENQFKVKSVLRRFSIDSVFAGLAAAIAIFVRKFALQNLR